MKSFKVLTNDFEMFDKLSSLNLVNSVTIKNTLDNRRRLNLMFNNINKRGTFLEYRVLGNDLYVKKLKDFKLNIFFRN